MMYQPSCRFSDSDNIVIIGKVPYYYLHGKTYRDRLKNRLSIDYDILFNTPPQPQPIEAVVPQIEIMEKNDFNEEKERKIQKRISTKYDTLSMYEGIRPIAKKNRQKLRKHKYDKYDNDKKINKLNIVRNKTIKNKKRHRCRVEKLLFIKENTEEEETEGDENDWDYFWESLYDTYDDFDYYYNW